MIDINEIEHNFKHHPPNSFTGKFHAEIREECKRLAHKINHICEDSREKSVAMRKLEECMMWANAAIARHGITQNKVKGIGVDYAEDSNIR